MATKADSKPDLSVLGGIFGEKPEGAIYLPSSPFSVRFDCKMGQLKVGDNKILGNKASISLLKANRYFGSLGMTKNTEWLQIFYVAAPSDKVLPKDTVCVSYIKTRSLGALNDTVTLLMAEGNNPALGIFDIGFVQHSGENGTYFSVNWEWRDRESEAETEQLSQIAAFLQSQPALADIRATTDMISLAGLTPEEITLLVESRTAQQAQLEASQPKALAAG